MSLASHYKEKKLNQEEVKKKIKKKKKS